MLMVQKHRRILGEVLILLLGTVIFLPRLGELPYQGEETRRVICAQELIFSGNFFVPTIQGELFLSRPPFQNWIIALTGTAIGNFGHLSGRLPSFLCVLGTTLLIYFYCRNVFSDNQFSRSLPMLAALFFLGTAHIVKYGALAETEMMFTFLLAGSYLFWHWGEQRGWPNMAKWTLAYVFLAMATLTKGFNQAPLYFATIVGLSLLLNKRLSNLLTRGHLIGLLVFFAIVGFWQLGFTHYAGWEVTKVMHLGDVAMRFEDTRISKCLEHWLLFPFEQWGVLLPWSIFLLPFLSPAFYSDRAASLLATERNFESGREGGGKKGKDTPSGDRMLPLPAPVLFCLGAIAVTFLTVWIPPGARTRYYIPMIPCFVILSAFVVEQCRINANDSEKRAWWFGLWRSFLKTASVLLPLLGLLAVVPVVDLPVPWSSAVPFMVVSLLTSLVLLRSLRRNVPVLAGIALIFWVGIANNLIWVDILQHHYNDAEAAVGKALERLPANTELHSIGTADHKFVYAYMLHTGKMLPARNREQTIAPGQYFCIKERDIVKWMPPNGELLERIPCARSKKTQQRVMVIGRVTQGPVP